MVDTPFRFVAGTLNLWGLNQWPQRRESLEAFLAAHRPDILGVQELKPPLRDSLDAALAGHARVDDPFMGWEVEGNIYWNRALFEEAGHGTADLGMLEAHRRLFWVRLSPRQPVQPDILVATAHFTWPGHPEEAATGRNLRMPQARRALEVLDALAPADNPALFMGDLNDFFHPLAILRAGGFEDCFRRLGRMPPPTMPAPGASLSPPRTWDWILSRGPLRPMCCDVVDFRLGHIPPSDHKPVLAAYRLEV